MNVRVALECQEGSERGRLRLAEGVMQLDALVLVFQVATVGEQRRDADAACNQQVFDRVLGRREVVRGDGDRQLVAALDFLVHVFGTAPGVRRELRGDEV